MASSRADVAARPTGWNASSHVTKGAATPTLTPAAIHAQVAAGAPLNVTTGFTMPSHPNGNVGYSALITLGAGGANPVVYTVTGTLDGVEVVENITAEGAGTYESTKSWDTITSLTSDVDPEGATDIDTLDIYFKKPVRSIWVGGTGIVSVLLDEDTADLVIQAVPSSGLIDWAFVKRLRCDLTGRSGVQETTATLIAVAR